MLRPSVDSENQTASRGFLYYLASLGSILVAVVVVLFIHRQHAPAPRKLIDLPFVERAAVQMGPRDLAFLADSDGKFKQAFQDVGADGGDSCGYGEDNAAADTATRRGGPLANGPSRNGASQVRAGAATLSLHALSAAYPIGYPIAIEAEVTNTGQVPAPVVGRLRPPSGEMMIEVRSPGSAVWKAWPPPYLADTAHTPQSLLQPRQMLRTSFQIAFGMNGWTFEAPGRYQLRAALRAGWLAEPVVSAPIDIEIYSPTNAQDAAAERLIRDADQQLDLNIGLFMAYSGRAAIPEAYSRIASLVANFPETPLGAAARVLLANYPLQVAATPGAGTRNTPAVPVAAPPSSSGDLCTDEFLSAAATRSRTDTTASHRGAGILAIHTISKRARS